jgi:hypothetical protein
MKKLFHLLHTIRHLPIVSVQLDVQNEEGIRMYNYYTRRHPRFFVIKNKTIGVALIALNQFLKFEDFLSTVSGKNSAAYYARRSEKSGYQFRLIDPNSYSERIQAIHLSAPVRQGKTMSATYLNPLKEYPQNAQNSYYGLFKEQELIAYLWCVRSGELITFNRLLGHADYLKDGVMYHLLISGIKEIFQMENRPKFIMYDTILGASEGLGLFKKRLGFKPYRVTWQNNNES